MKILVCVGFTMLTALGSTSLLMADESPYWSIEPLDTLPNWYERVRDSGYTTSFYPPLDTFTKDSVSYIVYHISDTSEIVFQQRQEPAESTTADDQDLWLYDGKIAAIDTRTKDTSLIDQNLFGISGIEFDSSCSNIIMFEVTHWGADVHSGSVVKYDLQSRTRSVLAVNVGWCTPEISPDGQWITYDDFGDLYVCNLECGACERVFHKGGMFSSCMGEIVYKAGIRSLYWSEEDECFIFAYSPDVLSDEQVKYYRACLRSPN